MVRDTSHLKSLVDYIKKNRQKGYDRESLKWALVKQGHMRHEIDKAFEIAESEIAKESPQPIARPEPKMEVITNDAPKIEPEKQSFWKRLFS